MKKLFLKILQYSQENTCVRVPFLKSCEPSGLQLFKQETPTQMFPVDIAKFSRLLFRKTSVNCCF